MKHHVQIGKEWLKGRLQIAVLDQHENVICICGDDEKWRNASQNY